MKRIISLSFIIAAVIAFQSCSLTTASISDIKLCIQLSNDVCADDNPVFTTDDPQIYVSCIVNNAPQDTKIIFGWYYADDERIEIDEVSVSLSDSGTYPVYSVLSAPYSGWPPGSYEVVISIDGFEDKTQVKSFKVR
jgi:hypothetical protein